ncbi:hypothetical protein RhiirA5_431713 [Rhizophagus irregularis]|uniref:Uncharacterized protein n=1 Tax=Rhizophagus irregularis TaxID=588596 RepID=A0A2N0NUK9_9GLOM|nr:hypothetical protein RhiirA5_431713 [Rhizophagus irregularis]
MVELPRPPLTPINNLPEPSNNIQFKSNTTAQNHLLENLQKVKNDLYEYNNLLRAASTPELRSSFTLKIKKLEETVMVLLRIAAVGRTFKTIQATNEPVSIPDYDFSKAIKHKLIPSVYLLINPSDKGPFHEFTHNEDSVKPFWCLLTDAGIELDAFAYGKHLESINGKVTIVNEDLGRHNFRHAGERLCELWEHDKINGHPVIITYVEKHDRSDFLDIEDKDQGWCRKYVIAE